MPSLLSPVAPTAVLPIQVAYEDKVKASVGHLLVQAYSLPCSTAFQAFSQLVQPTSRFQVALDALLPLLDLNAPCELEQRILVSFILYSLYAPHPIAMNPFKSVLVLTFVKEKEAAMGAASHGDIAANEQLVWVLWKILKGDGNDIGPYSPTTLARSPLPPKLRATNLFLDNDLYNNDLDDTASYDSITHAKSVTGDHTSAQATPSPVPRYIAPEEDAQRESLTLAMKVLLAARDRALTLSEQRLIAPMIPALASSQILAPLDVIPIAAYNPILAHPLFVELLCAPGHLPSPFLNMLPYLPPTLPTFDLMGRLLRDTTVTASGQYTIAELVASESLGRFISESIHWLDQAERDEREGLISDDRFAKGVQNLCRFYHSLIKLSIVDPTMDSETAEMMTFSLRHARFEEANALYRVLATGRF